MTATNLILAAITGALLGSAATLFYLGWRLRAEARRKWREEGEALQRRLDALTPKEPARLEITDWSVKNKPYPTMPFYTAAQLRTYAAAYAAQAVAQERERCVRACEQLADDFGAKDDGTEAKMSAFTGRLTAQACADAIRAKEGK